MSTIITITIPGTWYVGIIGRHTPILSRTPRPVFTFYYIPGTYVCMQYWVWTQSGMSNFGFSLKEAARRWFRCAKLKAYQSRNRTLFLWKVSDNVGRFRSIFANRPRDEKKSGCRSRILYNPTKNRPIKMTFFRLSVYTNTISGEHTW